MSLIDLYPAFYCLYIKDYKEKSRCFCKKISRQILIYIGWICLKMKRLYITGLGGTRDTSSKRIYGLCTESMTDFILKAKHTGISGIDEGKKRNR